MGARNIDVFFYRVYFEINGMRGVLICFFLTRVEQK